jgi:hypothetical protein
MRWVDPAPTSTSSRIRIAGSWSTARATARRCRWPPESRRPCSPTGVLRPSGQESTSRHRQAISRARRRSSSVAAGATNRRFSATVPANRNGVLTHHAEPSPVALDRQVAEVGAVDEDLSTIGIPGPGEQGLPGWSCRFRSRRQRLLSIPLRSPGTSPPAPDAPSGVSEFDLLETDTRRGGSGGRTHSAHRIGHRRFQIGDFRQTTRRPKLVVQLPCRRRQPRCGFEGGHRHQTRARRASPDPANRHGPPVPPGSPPAVPFHG